MSSPAAIRFNDFTASGSGEDLAAIRRVLDSGWLILGNEVRNFETEWAKRCGVEHAIGVGNGLDAIEIGLRALGIGPGDEVVTTPMTALATVLGILRAGATPVLAEIDPETALLDQRSVERCITPATRAILLVHLYGQMRDMDTWSALCSHHDILLLEDCAQSHDAAYLGRLGGSWGAFGAYSFYPTKNLGGIGDGGALVTNDLAVADLARSLRNYGQSNRYEHPVAGLNSRLDEVQAAVLSARLKHLASATHRRREIAARYRSGIQNPAVTLLAPPAAPENHVYHLFVIRTEERDSLRRHLATAGIETLIHYPIPAHHQVAMAGISTDPNGLGQTEEFARTCLSLPCAPHLDDSAIDRVIAAVNAFRP